MMNIGNYTALSASPRHFASRNAQNDEALPRLGRNCWGLEHP